MNSAQLHQPPAPLEDRTSCLHKFSLPTHPPTRPSTHLAQHILLLRGENKVALGGGYGCLAGRQRAADGEPAGGACAHRDLSTAQCSTERYSTARPPFPHKLALKVALAWTQQHRTQALLRSIASPAYSLPRLHLAGDELAQAAVAEAVLAPACAFGRKCERAVALTAGWKCVWPRAQVRARARNGVGGPAKRAQEASMQAAPQGGEVHAVGRGAQLTKGVHEGQPNLGHILKADVAALRRRRLCLRRLLRGAELPALNAAHCRGAPAGTAETAQGQVPRLMIQRQKPCARTSGSSRARFIPRRTRCAAPAAAAAAAAAPAAPGARAAPAPSSRSTSVPHLGRAAAAAAAAAAPPSPRGAAPRAPRPRRGGEGSLPLSTRTTTSSSSSAATAAAAAAAAAAPRALEGAPRGPGPTQSASVRSMSKGPAAARAGRRGTACSAWRTGRCVRSLNRLLGEALAAAGPTS